MENTSHRFHFFGPLALLAISGLSFAACGGGESQNSSLGSGGGSSSSSTSTSTSSSSGSSAGSSNGERYATAFCDLIFKCCDAKGLDERFAGISDYGSCRVFIRTVWDGALEPIGKASEAAGRSAFSQENFDSCIDKLAAASCADFETGAIEACEDIFVAKVPLGGVCEAEIDCIGGDCSIPSGMSQGTCAVEPAPVGPGGNCSNDQKCDKGLYCNAGVCAIAKADGQSCQDNDECTAGTCIGDDAATPGMCGAVCQGGGAGPGPINAELEAIGGIVAQAECEHVFNCCTADEADNFLFPGMDTKWECLSFYSAITGLALAQLNTKEVEGKVKIDGAALKQCAEQYAGLSCVEFSKGGSFDCEAAIQGLVANGGACEDDGECESRNCDSMSKCAPLPGAGGVCNDECIDGYYCGAGICQKQKMIGEQCSSSDECIASRCAGPSGSKLCALICDGN